MISCPSDEKLKDLLADELSPAEQDTLARHVDGCASCQAKLDRLTRTPDRKAWQRVEQTPLSSEAEEGVVRRLKEKRPSSAPADVERPARAARGDADWPAVPGYQILGELGRGGMGVVYRAQQLALPRTVALKMIRTGTHAGPRDLARFRAEAAVIARLQHPHIVQIYDVGEAEGRPFLVLEFMAGGSLAQHLNGSPQPVRAAAEMVETLARAVQAAHAIGVVHRDLKPANILLAADRAPKITDFGLAKCLDSDSDASGHRGPTVTGELLGTPHYMAPEQAATPRQPVGPFADVYALGAILYELLTGRPPFTGDTPLATVLQVLHTEPVSVTRLQPNVPRDLETICLQCLRKEPRRRYASALELADDLHRFLAGEPVRAQPVGLGERAWKWARRRPAVAGLSAAVVLVIAAALGLLTWQWRWAEGEAVRARRAEGDAEARRRQAEAVEAHLALHQGQALCEGGDVGAGVLWLARALDRAVRSGTAELDWPVRVNLADWAGQICPASSRLENPGAILGLAFGPADRTLLAAGKDGRVHCWDLAARREAHPALVHPRFGRQPWVSYVQFSPDGRTIATAGLGTVVVWDASTYQPDGVPLPHRPGMLWGMAFFPDGRRLATCSDDGSARVWDLPTRRVVLGPLWHAKGNPGYFTLAVSPDGQTLVTAGSDNRAIRWDLGTGKPVGLPLQHDSSVLKALFTPDGTRLLTSTRAGTLHAWDLRTGRATDLPRQGTEINGLALAPDGRRFATATDFGVVRLWDTDSLRPAGPVYRYLPGVSAVAFSRDGRRLALGMLDGGVQVVDLPPSREAAPPASVGAEVCSLQYAPGGDRLMAGTREGVRWVEAANGRPLDGRLKNPGDYDVECAALSPDGRSLAMGRWVGKAGFWRGRVQWWDPAVGTRLGETPDQPEAVRIVVYSPDGRRLFACGNRPGQEQGGALWDVATGRRLRPLLGSLGPLVVRQATFDPGGRVLLLACSDGKARIWDTEADVEVDSDRPLVHTAAVTACAFDPEGRRVLTGCQDGTARLWDVEARRLLVEPLRHDAEVSAVAFSPDGRTLLTASLDGTARFWDPGSGKLLGPALGHGDSVRAIAFDRAGRRAATGGRDGTVRQWRLPPPPVAGSLEQVRLWVEVLAGKELDSEGAVHDLSADDLGERRRRLEELGGPPQIPPG
jgi:WD40 repeat protein